MGLSFVVGMSSLLIFPTGMVEATANLESEQEEIQEQREEIQSNLSEAEQELAEILDEIEEINTQIEETDEAIQDNIAKMEETEEEIEEQEAAIDELEEEIEGLEKDIEERFELLKERASAYQKNGGNTRYLEVVLGSESFSDFVSRVFTVNKIAQADNEIIDQLEESQQKLEDSQAELQETLDSLNELHVEMEGMQMYLEEQQEGNDRLKEELEAKEAETENMMASLLEEDENLRSEEADIQARIDAERQRQQEERDAQAAAESNSSSSNSSNGSSNSNSGSSAASTASSGGGNGGDVTQVGQKYIGNSTYRFGRGRNSYDIENGIFDCSAFVAWSFSQVGISLPASTDGQKNAGRQVSTSEMRPGDLVFFNTYKTDGHVGIYMGGGQFIGAQSSTGVAIASLNSGYWGDVFNGRVVRVQ
jgi:peptidoglycan hydrolase CwlO-like protein